MLTTAELNNKLNELTIEYRKVVDTGNTAEILRWCFQQPNSSERCMRKQYQQRE